MSDRLTPDPEIWGRFTDREREIFAALAEGLSTLEIAARFEISKTTAGVHIARLFDKVGCARPRYRLIATVCRTKPPLIGVPKLTVRAA
jgi:DNA-binding NarL/FixJ family response regulator